MAVIDRLPAGMAGAPVSVRESAVQFGKDTTLIGVVSEPPREYGAGSRPAVLLLNAGLIHRVGPSRMYVRLARALARQGFLTLRFDLPGRGDSDVRRGADPAEQSRDVQAAMDVLEQTRGTKRFIVAGICSGAGAAAETALVDPRVAGAVLINPAAYPTLQSRIRYYTPRLGNARSWWNTLTGRNALGRTLRRALGRSAPPDAEMLDAQIGAGTVSRQEAVGILRRLVDRAVQLCIIYSAGPIYNYERQFADAFAAVDFRGQITVEYAAEADHTFTRLVSQQWLETAILGWVHRAFSPPTPQEAVAPAAPATEPRDRSGRDRLAKNIVWSWAGHTVFVIAGFVVPRLIDHRLGQAQLGVWDFCWSLVTYFSLAQVGIGASVNRHVAMHRAASDTAALNRTASSVMAVQLVAAGLVLLLTVAAVTLLPSSFGERLGTAVGDARWVIALLGVSFAFQMALNVYRGVLTGCHRWDLHYLIDSASYGLSAVGMTVALLLGGGLPAVAAIVLAGHVVGETARVVATYRVCPELEIRRRYATLGEAWSMLMFGGKLSIAAVAEIVLIQTNSLLVLRHLGVNALALYARPHALVRHVTTLAKKLALSLIPTAGSLERSGEHDALRDLLENGTRYASLLLTPLLLVLAILGDALLEIWMGPAYRQGGVLAVLALGAILPLTQLPAATILVGLNRHGVLAVTSAITAVIGVVMTWVTIGGFGWGLLGAAASIAVVSSVVGAVVPIAACRALDVPLRRYLWRGYTKPMIAMMPLVAVLFAARALVPGRPVLQACGGAAAGALVLAPLYWRWFFPLHIRQRIRSKVAQLARRPVVSAGVQSASGRVGE